MKNLVFCFGQSNDSDTSSSNTTRQSIETIERINNENIRFRDEMKELRRSTVRRSNKTLIKIDKCFFYVLEVNNKRKSLFETTNGRITCSIEEFSSNNNRTRTKIKRCSQCCEFLLFCVFHRLVFSLFCCYRRMNDKLKIVVVPTDNC